MNPSNPKPGFRAWRRILGAGASLLLFAGCQTAAPRPANPRPVAIYDFAFEVSRKQPEAQPPGPRVSPVGRIVDRVLPVEPPEANPVRLSALLSETIAEGLTSQGITAFRARPGAACPADALVVQGQFLEMDDGNRLRRAIVGFGAGSTEVVVEVSVFDLTRSAQVPLLTFGTGSGSKPLPGAILTLNPYVMAAKFVLSRDATDRDVRKLGREIAGHLVQIEVSPPATP